MTIKALSLGLAFAAVAAAPAFAVTNLVTNGDFTANSGGGQLTFNTSVTDWTTTAYSTGTGSYWNLWLPESGTTSGSSADNGGVTNEYGNIQLWGPGNGSTNGLTVSPNPGGIILGSDPAFQNAALTQTITGLTAGDKYTLTFYWAAAQQMGFTGETDSGWDVALGTSTGFTGYKGITSKGFSGWMEASFTLTANAASDVLSFKSICNAADPGCTGTVPPFALLDSVSLTPAIPEPSTWAMMLAGFAALGYAGFRSQRRKAAAIV